jgi:hypothetical protein
LKESLETADSLSNVGKKRVLPRMVGFAAVLFAPFCPFNSVLNSSHLIWY